MVTLTDGAISQIKEITKDHPEGSTGYLQVGIKGGGCSGFEYQFFLLVKILTNQIRLPNMNKME